MVGKRAVRKQQDTSHLEVARAFAVALEQCIQNADPEAVHRVRTGSRRLQAMIQSTPSDLAKPVRRCLRQIKKIRRAAGVVRDLDVQRKLLQGWLGGDAALPLPKQAQELDAWLKDQRKDKALDMQHQISKPRLRLEEREAALLAALGAVDAGKEDSVAMDCFVRAADAMPRLDAENLHDFRKAAKKARYISESGSAELTSVATALKRIQDAIGEWHDWLCLRQDAGKALGKNAPDLTAALDREVERRYSAAIKITETMRGRLLGEWLAVKRPPASTALANRRTA